MALEIFKTLTTNAVSILEIGPQSIPSHKIWVHHKQMVQINGQIS